MVVVNLEEVVSCLTEDFPSEGREFTVSSAVINGNLDPVGPDMYA
jgi:hypothetical protein